MSLENRAAQFAPFSALNGHEEAINETARTTSERINLSQNDLLILSDRLNLALTKISDRPELSFTVFVPDPLKHGGKYITVNGIIRRFNEYDREILLEGNQTLNLDDIISINGNIF